MKKVLQSIVDFIIRNKEILIIILIGAFFRFFRFSDLQFWSTDEELIAHFSRKIVEEHKIFLVSPIFTLSSSLGSGFQLITGVLYWIAQLDPKKVLLLGTLLSFETIILLYRIGYAIGKKTVGVTAALLYAASLQISLEDRRWWTLTTAPFFTALALYALVNLKKKNPIYPILLAVAIASAWQIDPNMAIIPVATLFSMLLLKIKLTKKQLVYGGLILVMSIGPLLIFELRHPGNIVQPILHHVMQREELPKSPGNPMINLLRFPPVYATYLLMQPHPRMDGIFNWVYEAKPISHVVTGVVWILVLIGLFIFIRDIKKTNHEAANIVGIFFITSIISLVLFTTVFHRAVQPQYVHVSIPIIYLLFSYVLYRITKRNNVITMGILALYVVINFISLTQIQFEFPLRDKELLAKQITTELHGQQFSLHLFQKDTFVNTGFTGLFVLNHANLVKSTDYMALDWWYRVMSLYFTTPAVNDPNRVVLIGKKGALPRISKYEIYYAQSGAMEAVILDNSTQWFDIKKLNQYVHQSFLES